MSKAEERALEAYPPKFSSGKLHAKRVQAETVDTHRPIRTIYIKGYEQAEKDLAMSYPMPEDTTIFQKGVAEGRRLEREDWINLIADLLFFEYFIQNMPNRGWGKDSTNNNTKEI